MNRVMAVIVIGVLMASGQMLSGTQALALPYFKCQSGYTFDINNAGTGAHCKKKIAPKVKPISCPNVTFLGRRIGTFANAKSGKDICRGQIKIAGVTQTTDHAPLACPTGYSYKRNYSGNRDRCVKSGGWVFKAPTVQFNSN